MAGRGLTAMEDPRPIEEEEEARTPDPAAASASPRPSLLGLTRPRLAEALAPYIDRRFRVDQVYRALHERHVDDFEALHELSKPLRQELARHFSIHQPGIVDLHASADGTVKYLLELDDGATIETVDIPDGDRRTLCISSQAGCALACRFCVTGYWGGGRNLGPGEIVGQVFAALRQQPLGERGLNLVFMGMGEPLLNLEALQDALEILLEQISWRRITVSTAGLIPGLEAMASWPRRPQLAISLHAPDDARRDEIMPINRKYPLGELMATLAAYPLATKQRITFEYILIRDFNDAPGDADALARLLRPLPSKVNLIPLNPDPVLGEAMQPPTPERVEAFRRRLMGHKVRTTVRRQRGDDVSAACGQLRAPHREARGFRRSNLRF